MAELFHGLGIQDDVIDENAYLPVLPGLLQVFLLNQERVDKVLVPLRKKEAWVPKLGHHRFNSRVARGTPDEADYEVKLCGHVEQEVAYCRRLSRPARSDAPYHERGDGFE